MVSQMMPYFNELLSDADYPLAAAFSPFFFRS